MTISQKGFIPVMLTPFKNDGAIDYDALTQLTNFYLEAGASGLFANCLSSEMYELEPDERLKSIKHVVDVANGSVPVVATGTFGGYVSEQAGFIRKVYDAGADAVIMITGLLADKEETDEVFNQRVYELLDITENIPLGFYECPEPYKRLLTPAQISKFAATGRIVYHKDTCLDINQVKQKVDAGKVNPHFGLYDAYMGHAVESLRTGAVGLSCIQGNFFPELVVWLCNNYADKALETEVNAVQQFFIDHMDVMHHVYPIIAKYMLAKRGLDISIFTRRNVGVFSPTVRKSIDDLHNSYKRLANQIELKVY
ncbi:MAG TPA: dihydrodipicolinate synthase family protein [Mucilaginibacter sp.]|jgi:4-hydroxy-tetrahydrodipicolinate synthase